jgi:hypothetical protein
MSANSVSVRSQFVSHSRHYARQVPESLPPAVASSVLGPTDVMAIILVFSVEADAVALLLRRRLAGSSLLRDAAHKLVQRDFRPIVETNRDDRGTRPH